MGIKQTLIRLWENPKKRKNIPVYFYFVSIWASIGNGLYYFLKKYLTNRVWCVVTLNPNILYWSSISTWLWRANVSIIIIPQISKNQIRSIEHMAVIPALLHKTRNLCSDTLWVTQWSSGQSFVKTRSVYWDTPFINLFLISCLLQKKRNQKHDSEH